MGAQKSAEEAAAAQKAAEEAAAATQPNLGRTRLDQAPLSPSLDLTKLASVVPHVPMIKFNRNKNPSLVPPPPPQSGISPSQSSQASSPPPQSSYEWWQRPVRFSRPDLDSNEINQINSGGADKIFQ